MCQELSSELQSYVEFQNSQFLEIDIEYFTKQEAKEIMSQIVDDVAEYNEGFYCRLSAPGYLDCTDWSGPFKTELEALQALYDEFGE